MNTIALALGTFIDHHKAGLLSLPEEKMTFKPSLLKWSRKEIIGHTIDSAQNNIRRFIVAQYEDNPAIEYNQDKWVTLSNYQEWNTRELVELWYLLNKQLVEILKNTPEAMAQRTCQAGERHSIHWLATDYLLHLRHHIHQVLELEPVPYP